MLLCYVHFVQDKVCAETRIGAAQLISAICRSGGATLWRDGGFYWDEAVRICIAAVSDASQTVRDTYAMALCDLAVAVRCETVATAVQAQQRNAMKMALEKMRSDNGLNACKQCLQQVREAMQRCVAW